jgi:hypothetical protein
MAKMKGAQECRAMALLCRQQAPIDPDKRWDLLAEVERWEYLAEAKLVANRERDGATEITHPPAVAFRLETQPRMAS